MPIIARVSRWHIRTLFFMYPPILSSAHRSAADWMINVWSLNISLHHALAHVHGLCSLLWQRWTNCWISRRAAIIFLSLFRLLANSLAVHVELQSGCRKFAGRWRSGLVMLMIIEQMQLRSCTIGSKLHCCMIHCGTCMVVSIHGSAVVAICSSIRWVVYMWLIQYLLYLVRVIELFDQVIRSYSICYTWLIQSLSI